SSINPSASTSPRTSMLTAIPMTCSTWVVTGPPCFVPQPVHRSAAWELRSSLRCGAHSSPGRVQRGLQRLGVAVAGVGGTRDGVDDGALGGQRLLAQDRCRLGADLF